ncbi:methionine sulfoxide reductase B [Halobacterium sp. DL1]|jgi:peptide-methionine (R)-S-oxide reductase|nr:methionine sulfoxide reductase B [Halobacterium sp. DL1]
MSNTPESETDWREKLTEEEYRVLREQGTERPYSGGHVDRDEEGTYTCAGCGAVLFDAETKFDAHCGWPSFWDAADSEAVERRPDHSQGMERTEVVCANCGGHLGHVFEDGPEPTGERFCINSVSLDFEPDE